MKLKHIISIFVLILSIISVGLSFLNPIQLNTATPVVKGKMTIYVGKDIKVTPSKALPDNKNTIQVSISTTASEETKWINTEINTIAPQAKNLNKNVLKLSLIAYQHAQKKGLTHNPLLTIVDYSKPSSDKRLWVVDLNRNKVLFNTWVAHGRNSGNVTSSSFSNKPESLKSSIGVFMTDAIYSGKHGDSLRVQGLESGVNDNAYNRSIVFHGANYVNAAMAKNGRIGRSWGCWAVSQDIISSLIKSIKNKVLVVAYYPDKKWLHTSAFLN